MSVVFIYVSKTSLFSLDDVKINLFIMNMSIMSLLDTEFSQSYLFIESVFETANIKLPLFEILVVCSTLTLYYVYKPMKQFFGTTNYKLDMTTKQYCKNLAEVDNSLKVYKKNVIESTLQKTHEEKESDSPLKKYQQQEPGMSINSESRLVNGWIPLLESCKVKPGSVRRAVVFGKDLIVTRSDDGKQVNVLDAYCPHAGVHIGVGGTVARIDNDSCVRCPFHRWAFRASDGRCVEIPYQEKKCIPSQARLGTWPCLEVDNFIYIWHHVDNEPPSWSMKPTPELAEGKWVLAGRSCHISNLDLECMHENGADMNHFAGIHIDFMLAGNIDSLPSKKYLQQFVKHCWKPSWEPVKDKLGRSTHMARLSLNHNINILGFDLFEATVEANQIGPAKVKLVFDSIWNGRGMLTMNSIPIGGRRLKYIQHVFTEPSLFRKIQGRILLYNEIKMLERDLTIWNHKKYLKNPITITEDKTVKQFRMWFQQFYRRKIKIACRNSSDHCDTDN